MFKFSRTFKFRDTRDEAAATIDYLQLPVESSAPHHAGRWYFKPYIQLANYRTRAVIDYLRLVVALGRTTQPRHVLNILKRSGTAKPGYALGRQRRGDPIYAEGGGSVDRTDATVTFHHPKIAEVEAAIGVLKHEYGVIGTPQISEIEVSVDFRSKSDNEEHRAQMVAVLIRHLVPPERVRNVKGGRPSFYGTLQDSLRAYGVKAGIKSYGKRAGKGRKVFDKVPVIPQPVMAPYPRIPHGLPLIAEEGRLPGKRNGIGLNQPENHPGFQDTFYVGRKRGDKQIKIMHKVRDEQQAFSNRELTVEPKQALELPSRERRARVEVTLRGEALNVIGKAEDRSLERLKAFQFGQLRKRYFDFRHPTFASPVAPSTYIEFRGTPESELSKHMVKLFLRAGVIPVYELQLVLKYLLDVGLQKKGPGRPRKQTFKEWSQQSEVHLMAYSEINAMIGKGYITFYAE